MIRPVFLAAALACLCWDASAARRSCKGVDPMAHFGPWAMSADGLTVYGDFSVWGPFTRHSLTNEILVYERDYPAFRGPNFLGFVEHVAPWGPYPKLLFTCDGGAFGQYDLYDTSRLEVYGTIDGGPCGITQFRDTVFAVACRGKGEIVLVDCAIHPCDASRQPKKRTPFPGVTGVAANMASNVLWAVGPKSVRRYRYRLEKEKDLVFEREWTYDPASLGGSATSARLARDGKIYFVVPEGVATFDTKTGAFARHLSKRGLSSYAPSVKGDLTLIREADGAAPHFLIGTMTNACKGARFAAACLQPVPTSDLH